MTYEQLRAAIIGRMMTFTGIDQSRIDYQVLTRFNSPADGLWCRLTIETAKPVVRGISQPQVRIPGHIIVQCYDRAISATPTRALVQLADALAAHFQFWTVLGLQCREAHLIALGQTGEFCQANVEVFFVTV